MGGKSGETSALADLGIEFGKEKETKIEPISFRAFGGRQGEPKKEPARNASHSDAGGEKQVKRKEVNLSELRQALEESLSNKKQSEDKKDEENPPPEGK